MRALLGLLLLTALGLGVTWLAVARGDEDTLVPSPPGVARAFLGHLEAGRPGSAAGLVAGESCALDEARLRAVARELRARWPDVQHLDAGERGRGGGEARAEVVLSRRGGKKVVVPVRLVREQGQWRVACLELPA